MVSHCCFPAFAAGQMPVLRTVVVFVSIQLPSVGTGVIVCVVFVCVISAAVFGLVLFIAFVAVDCDEFLLDQCRNRLEFRVGAVAVRIRAGWRGRSPRIHRGL